MPDDLEAALAKIDRTLENRKLEFYQPYPKQMMFHNVPADPTGVTERLLMAGNQIGKTLSASAECAIHATGKYPAWWTGRRFTKPTAAWAGGETSQSTRDNPQRLLLGRPNVWGTGMIPNSNIISIKRAIHGVQDAVETILIRHEPTGGTSQIVFKSYDQGRLRWQGETLDYVWFDEEPPMDIYSEGKTRVQAVQGIVFVTFTPLLGMSEVVCRFLLEKPPGAYVIGMGIEDALHYTPEQRQKIIAGYPAHERKARAFGIPLLGSGAVFPIEEERISEIAVAIPSHWPRICGMDIGWEHPTANVWLAWDRDTDTVHVYDCYRVKQQIPAVHAAAIAARGKWIPIAWPHDGLAHDKGSGVTIAKLYRDLGLNMLRNKSTHPPAPGKAEGSGAYGVEAGIMHMLERLETGRLKVAQHLNEWFEEYRIYHRKDGLIVKERDDLMSATRLGIMMLRFARAPIDLNVRSTMPAYRQSDPGMGVLG